MDKDKLTEQTENNAQEPVVEKRTRDKRYRNLKRTTVLSVLVLIALVVTINIILHAVVGTSWQFDWTANKAQSIGAVTEQLLSENDTDVKITVLAERDSFERSSTGADLSFVPKLLDEYVAKSNDKVNVDYVNPVANPAVLETLDPDKVHGITQNQIVVSTADYQKLKVLTFQNLLQIQEYYVTGYVAEEVISGAINFVTADYTPVVYWTTGHGEQGQSTSDNFSILRMLLEQNNYLVKEFNSLTAESVPDDAELLLMVAPTSDITPAESDMYLEFLKTGGSLFVMTGFQTTEMTNLNTLLREFNLRISSDRVIENEADRVIFDDPTSYIANIKPGALYQSEQAENIAIVLQSRWITTADNQQQWIKTEPVLETGAQATRQLKGDSESVSEAAVQTVGMYAEHSGWMDGSSVTTPAKVAVFGTDMSFSDNILMNFQSAGNSGLVYRALYHMSNMEALVQQPLLIQPKPVVSYAILPQNQGSIQLTSVILMGVLPIGLLVVALIVYRRRKRL